MRKRKGILGKHQIPFGRKFSRIHIPPSLYPTLLPEDNIYQSALYQSCPVLPSADIQEVSTQDPAYPVSFCSPSDPGRYNASRTPRRISDTSYQAATTRLHR